ncbi:MAG: glutamine-hydrolyzing GMP synthase [Flavobacteriaceae bacterium]|nr:glutamine-hydrolyzing GMP synthase [Flavobacteriaceae bacterium]
MHQTILILDFGSQYTQLIARRLRELSIYSEIHPFNHIPDTVENLQGVILSGSPCSVNEEGAPNPDLSRFKGNVPLLGVCYGAQLLTKQNGGEVGKSSTREFGRAQLAFLASSSEFIVDDYNNRLFNEVESSQVWMSHSDTIKQVPDSFEVLASSDNIPVAAFHIKGEETYGIQFHPEVTHSTDGMKILENFAVGICGCTQDWTPAHFIDETVANLKDKLGSEKVVIGLSGGVDSSVAAVLLDKSIGQNLYCVFIDNGLLRKNEYTQVLDSYKNMGLNVIGVDASQRFLSQLKGISDPETKRKTIGRVFIEVFEEEAKKISEVKWLAQGTIYPDVIESVSMGGPSQTIKSHHNVGGLPEKMSLKIVEPLRMLFKDEVRRVGKALGMNASLLGRHPFPGPGLSIRLLGEISEEKIRILQDADDIFIKALKEDELYDKVWQAGAIFLPVQSVGVMGDERTYQHVICLRAVSSVDGMTADWSHLPHEFLAKVSNRIINQVPGINRVVYDISSKPPATIEWE